MSENEKEDLPFERERRKALEKEEAMKIIGDLIAGDKGRDIFRGQPRKNTGLLSSDRALLRQLDSEPIETLPRTVAFGAT
jgi:hypothetical protein